MKSVKRTALLFFVLALSLLSSAQTPQPKISPVGTWDGFAENQGNQDELTVTIEKKGETYAGKVKDRMGMFPDVDIQNFVWKDNKVSFEFPGNMNSMAFTIKADLTLTEKTMDGTWTMAEDGSSGAVELTRK
jgi:uncharacterized protein Usg